MYNADVRVDKDDMASTLPELISTKDVRVLAWMWGVGKEVSLRWP